MIILSKVTKTAAEFDDIPYWLYSECATELRYALSKLINFRGAICMEATPVPKTTPIFQCQGLASNICYSCFIQTC